MIYPDLRSDPRMAVLGGEQVAQVHLATLERTDGRRLAESTS
jgi:hypothetical protein